MTRRRVQQKKAVRARRKGDDGSSDETGDARSRDASSRARRVSDAAARFLRKTTPEERKTDG